MGKVLADAFKLCTLASVLSIVCCTSAARCLAAQTVCIRLGSASLACKADSWSLRRSAVFLAASHDGLSARIVLSCSCLCPTAVLARSLRPAWIASPALCCHSCDWRGLSCGVSLCCFLLFSWCLSPPSGC